MPGEVVLGRLRRQSIVDEARSEKHDRRRKAVAGRPAPLGYHRQSPTMRLPRVYPILDSDTLSRCGVPLTTAAASFLEGGAGILQIRHKPHWTRDVYDAARTVARL